MTETPTASQTVGPFFSIGLDAFLRKDAAGMGTAGDRVTVSGRVWDGDGQPVPDAVLEIWAPGEGSEARGPDGYPVGFARVETNERGEFGFAVVPPQAREHHGRIHSSHVAVLVFMRGLLRHLVTRLYFTGVVANADDPVLQLVPEERRRTLIANATGEPGKLRWDVHLQGEDETVFFEV